MTENNATPAFDLLCKELNDTKVLKNKDNVNILKTFCDNFESVVSGCHAKTAHIKRDGDYIDFSFAFSYLDSSLFHDEFVYIFRNSDQVFFKYINDREMSVVFQKKIQ